MYEKLCDLAMNEQFRGRKYALWGATALGTLLLLPSTSVFANTDELGGTVSSGGTSPSSGMTAEQANEWVKSVQEKIPEPSKESGLEQINQAVNQARESNWGLASDIASPIGNFFMLGTNVIWFLFSFVYFFQTAVDVMSIVWSGPREYFMSRTTQSPDGQQGFKLSGFIGSFFALSLDARQVIEGNGLQSNGSAVGGQGYQQGSMYNQQGGGMYNQGGHGQQMMNGGAVGGSASNGQPLGTGNILRQYMFKRMGTLIFVGLSFALFATSFATEFQGQIVSLLMALIRGGLAILQDLFLTLTGKK